MNTMRQEVEEDIKRVNSKWKQEERIARDRVRWRVSMGGPSFSTRGNRHK